MTQTHKNHYRLGLHISRAIVALTLLIICEPIDAVAQVPGLSSTPPCVATASATNPEVHALPKVALWKTLTLGSYVTAITWSPDGRLLATSEKMDTVIKIWDVNTGTVRHIIQKQNKGTKRLLFTNDGRHLITSSIAGFDGVNRTALSIIDVRTGSLVRNVDGPLDPSHFPRGNVPRDFVLSPDGRRLYASMDPRRLVVHIYDTRTWSDIGFFPSSVFVMQAGPKADELTLVEHDGTVRIWDASANSFVASFQSFSIPTTWPTAIALDAATCRLATGASWPMYPWDQKLQRVIKVVDSEPIHLWDLQAVKKVGGTAAAAPINSLVFSPDGRWLAAATNDHKIILYAGNLTNSITVHEFREYAWRVAFSPDGKFLAAAGDNEVLIFKGF